MAYTENPILEGKDFESIAHDVNENFSALNQTINQAMIVGTYTGNGETTQDIIISNTDTPIAVEVFPVDADVDNPYNDYGLNMAQAIKGVDCVFNGITALSIIQNGFRVSYQRSGYNYTTMLNNNNRIYFYKAYFAGQIKNI